MNNIAVRDVASNFQVPFFAMCRLNMFPWESLEAELHTSSSLVILDILKKTCLHPVCLKNPPSVKYRRHFLSELIKRHESTASEPLDELYEALGEVVGAEEDSLCFKSYLLPSGEWVSLEENVALISGGTTGLVTWEAALCLAEWALENPHVFSGRSVLELGSGAGLTGMVVCRTCSPAKFVFSDCHESVLHRLRNNVQHNCLNEGSVCVEKLDWENADMDQLKRIVADIVIATDVVYDPDIIPCLVKLLLKLLKIPEKPPEVYLASTIRNPETYNRFGKELEKSGLHHLTVARPINQVFPYNRESSIEIIMIHL